MKFSLVAPIYNEEKHIKRSIDSVLEQDVDFELIYMDGGSTDKTHEIIRSYNDPRIKLIIVPSYRGEDKELELRESQKRVNMGIELASGDIFFLTSGHDYFYPDAFKTVRENIGEAGWLMGGLSKVSEEGKVVKRYPIETGYSCGFILMDIIRQHNIKLDVTLAAADYDLFMQVKKAVGEPKRIKAWLYKYMIHPKALSKEYNWRMKRERRQINKKYFG